MPISSTLRSFCLVTGFDFCVPSGSPGKITSTPILPKPNLDHLKTSATLSTKRQSQRSRVHSRLVDSPSSPDDDDDEDEDLGASILEWKRHFSNSSLHSSFLHHSSHPLSPIKALAPQSRVFLRPRVDRASVVTFVDASTSASTSSGPSSTSDVSNHPRSRDSRSQRTLSALYDDKLKLEYLEQCFDVEKKIGEGSFGEVFQVRSKEDGRRYAVKRSRGAYRGTKDRKEKLGEVAKLEKMDPHPNCVQFFLAWEEKKHLYIQTEVSILALLCRGVYVYFCLYKSIRAVINSFV